MGKQLKNWVIGCTYLHGSQSCQYHRWKIVFHIIGNGVNGLRQWWWVTEGANSRFVGVAVPPGLHFCGCQHLCQGFGNSIVSVILEKSLLASLAVLVVCCVSDDVFRTVWAIALGQWGCACCRLFNFCTPRHLCHLHRQRRHHVEVIFCSFGIGSGQWWWVAQGTGMDIESHLAVLGRCNQKIIFVICHCYHC